MKKFLDNRMAAIVSILILAVGSLSIVGIGFTHVVKADQVGKVCIFFACGNANITGGTSNSGGGGGGGQPTPTTGRLIVTKVINDPTEICNFPDFHPPECFPQNYTIKVTGNNPSLTSFPGSSEGTIVTIGPGKYTVSETLPPPGSRIGVDISFSDDCKQDSLGSSSASGNINAGETQKCTITNKLF